MIAYYCATLAVNIIAVLFLYEYLNITALSAVPLLLIIVGIIQANIMKNGRSENESNTAYGSNLSFEENNCLAEMGS